jgi:carboxymethylenebutenolidase
MLLRVSGATSTTSPGREVTIPAGDGAPATPAFACLPKGATRGVVVIHEIFGRQPEIDRVVERFAAAGYAAVAPDLFHRGRFACLRDVFRTMQTGDGVSVRQGRNARAWLCAESGVVEDKVGLIGFCFGGGYVLAAGAGWAAVSSNYGYVPSTRALTGIGPVIACYGGLDRSLRDMPHVLKRRLERHGVEPEIHVFPNAGHSFLTDGDHPIGRMLFRRMALGDYPTERELGWDKIFDFFERKLG